jgi:prepilin-type N-terminal cleavage/methylation domain-containing protein
MRTRVVSEEGGFTMPELLVVVIIIGVLAAIALAVFTTQTAKGHDAAAKSNASELVSAVDRCYVDAGDYAACDGQGPNDQLGQTGLPIGPGKGQVSVTAAGLNTFSVEAISNNGHHFRVSQGPSDQQVRTCDAGVVSDGGGCSNGTW